MADVLPVDASCEDIDIDEKLKFLDGYVRNALSNGAVPYSPPSSLDNDDDDDSRSNSTSTVKFTPYEKPSLPIAPPAISIVSPSSTTNASVVTPANTPSAGSSTGGSGIQLLNNKGVSQVWGKKMAVPEPSNDTTAAATSNASHAAPTVTSTTAATSPFGIGSVFNNGATTPTSTSASAEPSKPRELTEKEKMAAALFGGVSASKNVGITKRRSSGGTVGITSATVGDVSTKGDDLFGGMTTTATASAAGVTDLFGGMSISTVNAKSPSPVPLDNILDLVFTNDNTVSMNTAPSSNFPEMTMLPNNPPPPVPPVAPVTQSNSISDMFADMSNPLPTTLPVSNGMNASSTPTLMGMSSFDALSNNTGTGAKPLSLTTNEFGIRWGQCPCETKSFVSCPRIRSLDILRTTMPSNYAHVESIPGSNEAIFAALTLTGSHVLIHVKLGLQRGGFDVIIKGTSKDIITNEMNHITSYFI